MSEPAANQSAAVSVTLRVHGRAPYRIAVLHGGPGAAGEMAPVAHRLSAARGVLEPMQSATSVDGQLQELSAILFAHAEPPVTLIGYSWGAWLALLTAASASIPVEKLILIGSGPLVEQPYTAELEEARLSRLTQSEAAEFTSLLEGLGRLHGDEKAAALRRFSALMAKTDCYDPIDPRSLNGGHADLPFREAVYRGAWPEGAALRRSGRLLTLTQGIGCPVTAIHGAYDPHPARGVAIPLSETLDRFRFVCLPRCGHTPWIERHAREAFFRLLEDELNSDIETAQSRAEWNYVCTHNRTSRQGDTK